MPAKEDEGNVTELDNEYNYNFENLLFLLTVRNVCVFASALRIAP